MKKAHHGPQEPSHAGERGGKAKLAPGKQTLSAQWPVQRMVAAQAAAPAGPDTVHAAADHGTSGAAGPLPHLGTIQRLFGRHDVTRVQAHGDARAHEGASAMGAQAFARGEHVAFAGAPDLHTAAHEAAHVVQQRAGVHLKGGVGAEGDAHEQHADAVADAVVAGRSAESLLSTYAAPSSAVGSERAVQQQVKARKTGTSDTKDCATLVELCAALGITRRSLIEPFKTRMFETERFPDAYKASYATVPAVQAEVKTIVEELDDLVAAAASQNVIVANSATEAANQLFVIIGAQITQARLDRYPYYQRTRTLGARGTRYMAFLTTAETKLVAYQGQIHNDRYDDESRKTNARMENRLTQLRARCRAMHLELTQEMEGANRPAEITRILDAITAFVDEVDEFEHAWDLDHNLVADGVNDQVDTLARNPAVGDHFEPEGGEDDEMNVGDGYRSNLACSLFALRALKPDWLGAGSEEALHRILRKTQNLRQYDDNAAVAKIRYLAGLTPTVVGGTRLDAYVAAKTQRGERDSFIVDITGEAHTFAAVWKNGAYRKVDDTGSNGDLGDYAANTVIAIWQ